MKKKFLITLAVVAMLVCLFAISVSADTIVSSTSDAYGTLCQFDEAIGNTQISDRKDDGTVARTVLTDGNGNYYTIPTVCTLTESYKNRGNGVTGEMFLLSFSEISAKLGFTVSKNSIIRIEFPSDIKFICNGNENLSGCANMVECIMNDGVYFWDNSSQRKVFTNCKKLKSIDVSGMIMDRAETTFAMFEYCPELEYVKLPDAYLQDDGTYMDYNTSHMFSGCNKLKTIENMEGFFKGDKTLNYKTFYNCWVLREINLPNGLEKIDGRAIGLCNAITTIVIPDTVTVIGTGETVFESCASLKNIVFPSGAVSVGNYAFEKCKVLENIWMPGEGSTFGKEVFGQCGSGRAVNFYFTTETSTVTVTDKTFKDDPYISAINATNGDERLKYNTPLSTKCTVFLGGHNNVNNGLNYANGFNKVGVLSCSCSRCATLSDTESAPIITMLGYATGEENGRITLSSGFVVDTELVDVYNSLNETKLVIGILFADSESLAESVPANLEGIMHRTDDGFATYNYVITFPNADDGNYEKYATFEFVVSAFICENENYVFFSNNTDNTVVSTLNSGFTTTTLEKIQSLEANESQALVANELVYNVVNNDELVYYVKESYYI